MVRRRSSVLAGRQFSMPVAGRRDWGGFAIIDHPESPVFPVTWRVDNKLGVSPSRR